jgi:hypothetical protein
MGKNASTKIAMILDGWKNLIVTNPKVEELAQQRATICAGCKELNNLLFCKACGCFVPAAIRSKNKKCKLKLW